MPVGRAIVEHVLFGVTVALSVLPFQPAHYPTAERLAPTIEMHPDRRRPTGTL